MRPLPADATPPDSTPAGVRGVYNQTIGQGIAVRADGVLVGWGEDVTEWGEEWNGAPVELDQDVVAVCGSVFSVRYLLLKNDGTLWSRGLSGDKNLGRTGSDEELRAYGKVLDNVAYVTDTCAVRTDGTLWSWGENYFGSVGNGSTKTQAVPVQVLEHVVAAWKHMNMMKGVGFALTEDGALWSWGANFSGGLGFEGGNKKHMEGFSAETAYDIYYQDVPRKIDMTDVLDAYVGDTTYLLKRDGSLWAAGSNYGDARCIMGGTDNSPEGFNKIMDGVKLPEGVAPATTPSTQTGAGFADVKTSEYWYKPILWAVENGITNGTSATAFSPNQTCSRAHIVTFLYRAEGSPSKTGNGEWYDDAANWANRGGLLAGTAEAFRPGADCPRADVVYYLWRDLAK